MLLGHADGDHRAPAGRAGRPRRVRRGRRRPAPDRHVPERRREDPPHAALGLPGAAGRRSSSALTESTDDEELLAARRARRARPDVHDAPAPGRPASASLQLLRDPYVLVVPADSPLARRDRPPTLREIVELPLIGNRHCRSLDAGPRDAARDGQGAADRVPLGRQRHRAGHRRDRDGRRARAAAHRRRGGRARRRDRALRPHPAAADRHRVARDRRPRTRDAFVEAAQALCASSSAPPRPSSALGSSERSDDSSTGTTRTPHAIPCRKRTRRRIG